MWIKIEQMSEFGKHLGKKVAVGITENSLSKEESGTIVQDPEMGVCVLTERGTRIPLDGTMMNKTAEDNRSIFMWAAPTEAIFPEGAPIHGTPGPDFNGGLGGDKGPANPVNPELPAGQDQELNQAATADEVQT